MVKSGSLIAKELLLSDRYQKLSDSIKSIVEAPLDGNNVRIIAGAGSGKTETIAFRIINLLLSGKAKPEEIVAFTFTEKAAESLKARIYQRTLMLGRNDVLKNLGKSYIGTIHGFCFRLLQDHFNYANYRILDEPTERIFIQRIGYQLKLNESRDILESRYKIKVTKWREGSLYSFMCNLFIESYNIILNERLLYNKETTSSNPFPKDLEPFINLIGDYFDQLKKNRLLTFSQVIELATSHLEQNSLPVAGCKFVFVDEYQDINKAQERLIFLLGTKATVFVVGDPKQTIYNWRGSTNEFFNKFQDLFPGKKLKDFQIPENWRSFPAIVAASNEFAREANIDMFHLISEPRRTGCKGLTAKMMFESDLEEAEYITTQIKTMVEAEKICEYNDISILLRSVKTSAYPFIKKCIEKKIPYIIGGKVGLFNRKEIQAIVRFLFWLSDKGFWRVDRTDKITQDVLGFAEDEIPKETGNELLENGVRLWLVSCEESQIPCKQTEQSLRKRLVKWRADWLATVADSVSRLGKTDRAVKKNLEDLESTELEVDLDDYEFKDESVKFLKESKDLNRLKYDTYMNGFTFLDIFNDLLNILGIKRLDYKNTLHVAFISNCARFSRILNDFEFTNKLGGRTKTFNSLLNYLNNYISDYRYIFEENPEEEEKFEGGVNIFTVHQSKGLEWPIVFIPSIVPGRFPVQSLNKLPSNFLSINTNTTPIYPVDRYITTIEDEARLLYVGMTRAKNVLFLSEYASLSGNKRNLSKSKLIRKINFQDFSIQEKELPLHKYPMFPPKKEFEAKETFFLEEFGITTLLDYLKCPFFYRFRHVWEYAAVLNRFLGFGTAIHHVLRRLIERSANITEGIDASRVESLLTEIIGTEFVLPYLSKTITDKLAASIYRKIIEHVKSNFMDFKQCIGVENHIEFLNENAILNGTIDMILKETEIPPNPLETVHIRDYKTQKMGLDDIHKFQILLYSAAMIALGYHVKGGSIAFIKENEIMPIDINTKAIQDVKDRARLVVEDIKNKRYKRIEDEDFCKKSDCDYFVICNQTE